jgi:outer membrane protein TolC
MFALVRFMAFYAFVWMTFNCYAEDSTQNSMLKKIKELENKSIQLSPELKVVRNFYYQKNAEAYTRITAYLPQANFNIKKEKDFFEERNAPLRALGLGPFSSTWSIDYQWSLLNYGSFQASRKSFAEKDKAELEVLNKEKEYPISFNTYFLNYLLAKYKKAAVENSLKKAETGKKEAKLGFELGQKTKLDVLRSEANFVSLDSKKTSYIDEEQNTKSKLLEYSGLDNSDLNFFANLDEAQIISIIDSTISSISVDQRKRVEPIFAKSPILQSLRYDEKINKIALASLTQAQWPQLKIQGSYNNAGNTFDESIHSPYRTHSIALILSIPLFGSGNFISSNFEEYFAKKQIEYTMAQKILEMENNLNNTLIKINALETLVASLSLNVSQYEELYRLTLKSYQLGKSSLFELLEVQDNLLDSKINLAQNKIQFYTLSQNYQWQAGL